MNFRAVQAIYLFEMARTWRTLMQSIISPVVSTSLYFVVFGIMVGTYLLLRAVVASRFGRVLRGISETGVPTIETEWVPPSKQSEIGATFTKIAKPTLQCMFEPAN